jgi:hypothetical protein
MAKRFELPRDAGSALEYFPVGRTYTREQPNAVEPRQMAVFLAKLKELYPQHYAMTLLGFAIGARPSTLRPRRRRGPDPDVLLGGLRDRASPLQPAAPGDRRRHQEQARPRATASVGGNVRAACSRRGVAAGADARFRPDLPCHPQRYANEIGNSTSRFGACSGRWAGNCG